MSKVIQDVYIAIGSFIVFCGIAFFAYYYTTKVPILSSTIGLILAVVLTISGIVLMYIGDRSGRRSGISTEQ
jgi:uncharacterized membrane protein (DUF485 family)